MVKAVSRKTLALLVALAAFAAADACSQDVSGAGDGVGVATAKPAAPKPAGPAAPAVLAEATNPDAPVVVQVLDVRRASADTVYVAFAATNTSRGESLEGVRPLGDAKPADFCLITADGVRRLFLLRDPQDRPVLEGDPEQPLKPGERRLFQAQFPAPPAADAGNNGANQPVKVTLLLGKLVLRNVPIPAQPTAAP